MEEDTPTILGIDYGSKRAGTTSIAINFEQKINLYISKKKKDADQFIWEIIELNKPQIIAIDAPLSLPLGLYHSHAKNYFYRKCDKDLHAMSPMFLGGLTARAMKLKDQIQSQFPNTTMIETYPKAQWSRLSPNCEIYKKQSVNNCLSLLKTRGVPKSFQIETPTNWHEFDALLAWIGGYRFYKKKNMLYGDTSEGLISV